MYINSAKLTFLNAGTTAYAAGEIDNMRQFAFAGDGIDRTRPGTKCTAFTFFGIDEILCQRATLMRRAAMLLDMRQIFFEEIIHGR